MRFKARSAGSLDILTWHNKFLWWPTKIKDQYVWLEWVRARATYQHHYGGTDTHWEYNPQPNSGSEPNVWILIVTLLITVIYVIEVTIP